MPMQIGPAAPPPVDPRTARLDAWRVEDSPGLSTDRSGHPRGEEASVKRRDLRWALWAVAVLLVAGGGAGAAYAFGAFGRSPTNVSPKRQAVAPTRSTAPPRSTTTTATVLDLARTEAQSVNTLLLQSSSDRNEIVEATADIGSCGNLGQDQATLESAEQSRQALLGQLSELKTSQLPESTQLVSALTAAWQASLQSDSSYAAWAGDLEQMGCVGQASTNDPNFQAAQSADTQATTAKNQFVTLWNSIASTYGLPQYNASQI
jgi:hypothetical protein